MTERKGAWRHGSSCSTSGRSRPASRTGSFPRRQFMLAAPALAVASRGHAETWPSQPIRLMHGYDAGSNPDTIARHLAPGLGEALGVQIIIEAKPGAAERLAASQIARMKPDGQVIYLMTGGQAVVSATDKTLSYRLLQDFDFIGIVTRFPFVFTVAPDSRFKTLAEYVAEARREPGKLTYGTSGVGSTLHMAMELMLSQVGVQMTHVPYKGGIGAPFNDLVGGRLDMHVVTFSNAQPLIRTDKLRALAVTSKERHPGFPDVPTVAEVLVPGYDVVSWLGFAAPAGLPPGIAQKLHAAIVTAMANPAVKAKLEELGNDTRVTSPAEFRARVEADMSRWGPLAHVINQS
jgi:tripartite-type tricarboxylate transporter receptor subunit TctC